MKDGTVEDVGIDFANYCTLVQRGREGEKGRRERREKRR
jgi:hypothetical protein